MSDQIKSLPVGQLQPHPRNPRLVMREDVIESIRAGLKNGFQSCYALQVWQGQVLSGHHRLEAAKREGIAEVPCFVRDELSEEEAYMVLATANAQGELSPLEIGMHALHYVEKATGGRGQKGGLSAYAAAVGKDKGNLSRLKDAAEVAEKCCNDTTVSAYLDKAAHLAAIHKLPDEVWKEAAEWAIKRPVSEVSDRVSSSMKAAELVKDIEGWFTVAELVPLVFWDKITPTKIGQIIGLIAEIKRYSEANGIDGVGGETVAEFIAKRSTNPRDFLEYHQAMIAASIENTSFWNLGKWQNYLNQLEDESVSLVLTDPPYGMEYQSNFRKERHDKIEGDDSTDAFSDSIAALLPKMRPDCHVLAFVNWQNESAFMESCRAHGLVVKSSVVWVKNNTSMGDLRGAFAPKHERIVHAVKGSPALHFRMADVVECARVDTSRHPTEKPTELITKLIEACTLKKQIIADPFGGVASVAVAAKESGREYWSCEVNEKYFRAGERRLES